MRQLKFTWRSLPAAALAALLLLSTSSCRGPQHAAIGPPVDVGFLTDAHWSDGRAEVNYYEAVEPRYGIEREADEAVLIFVKEDHRSDTLVKADDPARADLPAMKLNWITSIPTGIYTYQQMASVYVHRETGEVFRETFASHEWCGNTFLDLRTTMPTSPSAGDYRLAWTSYFAGEARGEKRFEGGAVPADALLIRLRALPFEEHADRRSGDGADATGNGGDESSTVAQWPVTLLPSLRRNRVDPDTMRPVRANVRLAAAETIETPAGSFACRLVEVEAADPEAAPPNAGLGRYWIEAAFPHRLIAMELADGSTYRLARSERLAYWQMNDPEFRDYAESANEASDGKAE